MVKIKNPILRGFNPDPCICKAKHKYFIATSTFEWFPGVQIYESYDLVSWSLKCSALNNLDLKGIPDSAGIWAPALTFYKDTFYLIYTIARQIDGYFKDVSNYVITAKSIEGPWSEPLYINSSGFDPSMYHEENKHYVINVQWDSRPLDGHNKFNGLVLQEFDFNKGMVGQSKVVYRGAGRGGVEGPHILKKENFYYIISAEGGTGRHHSICVARSKNIWGPYEVSPYTPLITAWEKDTILKKSGHGNFVETDDNEWYMTHLCSRYLKNKNECILGRETALQKLEWINGWPRMVQGDDTPALFVEAPKCAKSECVLNKTYETEFKIGINFVKEGWMCLRESFDNKIKIVSDGVIIKGNDSLTSTFNQSLIARKYDSFNITTETQLEFNPNHYSQMAGLTCYYNTKVWYFLYVGYDEKSDKRIINILVNNNMQFSEPLKGNYIQIEGYIKDIYLKAELYQDKLQFYYKVEDSKYEKIGPVLDSSILSDEHAEGWAYTGAVNGITAIDLFNKDTYAKFKWFKQVNNEEDTMQ